MKKRLLTLMLASVMAFAGSIAVYAEDATEAADEAEVMTISWSMVEDQVASSDEWAGDFVEMEEIGLKMYVPEAFEQVELTDEDLESGYLAYFAVGDEAGVSVIYADVDGMSLEEYQDTLASEYDIEAQIALVNDIPTLAYSFEEDGVETAVLAFTTDMGNILEISFAPVNDEGFKSVAYVMMASIQIAE